MKNTITYLSVNAPVRYPEDNIINRDPSLKEVHDDEELPGLDHGMWRALIRLEDGEVMGWPQGTRAELNIKVVDSGTYYLQDEDQVTIYSREENYVPDCLSIDSNGYGDYIYITIQGNGRILNWPSNMRAQILNSEDFTSDED